MFDLQSHERILILFAIILLIYDNNNLSRNRRLKEIIIMNCEYFAKCGSCTLHDKDYEEQLNFKIQREKERFKDITDLPFDIIKSDTQNFRNRAEFRLWKNYDDSDKVTLSYAMNDYEKNTLEIDACSIVSNDIKDLMPILLDKIQNNKILLHKVYSCEFLNSTTGDMLVTIIYHRKLDEEWEKLAQDLEKELNIKIIGRSRKQKLIVSKDYIEETLKINNKDFYFEYQEGGFTQPNSKVNEKMIEWVLNTATHGGDLCELYCGGGNFTIPMSTIYDKVVATEISKTSIKSAKVNCALNKTTNIDFVRMAAEDFVVALNSDRVFKRLEGLDIKAFKKETIFVDPPRAGLDDTTRALSKEYNQIIYISCNPETLHRDLLELQKTHKITNFALFDQFAYTKHIESGVILQKI